MICCERRESFTKGGRWRILKYLKNEKTHEEGGVDIQFNTEEAPEEKVIAEEGLNIGESEINTKNTDIMSKVHNETDLTVADIITWKKSTSIPFQTSPTKLSRICELVYVIVKKEFLHEFKTNKQVSKVNEKTGQKFYKNYTNLIEAKNNDGIQCKLKASFSEDFVNKLLDIYFPEGSLIYDPFMGIGTTTRACKKSNRNYIGSELDKEHFDISISLL